MPTFDPQPSMSPTRPLVGGTSPPGAKAKVGPGQAGVSTPVGRDLRSAVQQRTPPQQVPLHLWVQLHPLLVAVVDGLVGVFDDLDELILIRDIPSRRTRMPPGAW
jgi:hypothetical protein